MPVDSTIQLTKCALPTRSATLPKAAVLWSPTGNRHIGPTRSGPFPSKGPAQPPPKAAQPAPKVLCSTADRRTCFWSHFSFLRPESRACILPVFTPYNKNVSEQSRPQRRASLTGWNKALFSLPGERLSLPRDGRVAEGGGLLNRCTVKSRTGGSNPPLSAILNFLRFDRLRRWRS